MARRKKRRSKKSAARRMKARLVRKRIGDRL